MSYPPLGLNVDDRNSINALSGHTLGAVNHGQLRDASSSRPLASDQELRPWTKQPTRINTPSSNNNHRPSVGGARNPFSGRTQNNLHSTRGSAPSKTYLEYVSNQSHPNKKPRLDGPVRRKKASDSPPRKQRLGSSNDNGAIVINLEDYEDEDVGQALPNPHSHKFNLDSRAAESSRRKSHPIADGESTKKLRRDAMDVPPLAPEDLDTDPITSYDSDPLDTLPRPGHVQNKIKAIEGKTSDASIHQTHPRLDLRTVPGNVPRQQIKSRMKAKNPSGAAAAAAEPPKAPVPSSSKPSAKSNCLPIKAWYLGYKFFDTPYHLVWPPKAPTITIRSGNNPNAPAKHSEEILLNYVAQSVSYVKPEDSGEKILCLRTFAKAKSKEGNQKEIGVGYASYFQRGDTRGKGDIVIKFDCASPTWADAAYTEFIKTFKCVEGRHTLTVKSGQGQWETAKRTAELFKTRAERETAEAEKSVDAPKVPKQSRKKSPAIRGIPSLDDWSPPPPDRIIPNTLKSTATTRSKRQGSSNAPIEIGSPERPVPPAFSKYFGGGGESDFVRRSTRNTIVPKQPVADADEVILVYPPNQTGAVNITNGDVARLEPGEFLNDTLIEFGLKLWLQELEKENPELAKQIHVFSSFFYKKLDNKESKDKKKFPEKGYESVRKWTAKFDLFEKKYIIVPINENLHWYLAIIYQPEHILKPPSPPLPPTNSPKTRRKAREEAEQSPEIDAVVVSHSSKPRPPDSKGSSITRRSPSPMETAGSRAGSGTLSPGSNVQAEEEVADQLTAACSINDEEPFTEAAAPETRDADDAPDSLFDGEDDCMDVDDDVEVVETTTHEPTPSGSMEPQCGSGGGSRTASEGPAPADPAQMEVDGDGNAEDPDQSLDPLLMPYPAVSATAKGYLSSVNATSFYGSEKSRGKRKAQSPLVEDLKLAQEAHPLAEEEEEAEVEVEVEVEAETDHDQPSTYVFVLDSLGGRHTRVYNVLGTYLQLEAQEKKGIPLDMSSRAVGKQALVPHQPNFCDCGIYLLHLAQTFMSDPERYRNLITKKQSRSSAERSTDWKQDETKTLRESLAERIGKLSSEWKKSRAEQQKKQEDSVLDSSDDDVDIVDTTPVDTAPASPPPSKKTTKLGKAVRMR
ncbi:hypothetical protein R3P38DRAFT_2606333 [Favolaschia claudopus]|uniref:Ubiquitin-like protease family profile domain-containing protein n=1 Tax=Favolaschia claudopus TaxID=2862362 RepID=A0AAW0DBQ0_9AGAR